jgi:bacteriocin biosynthesis cyclodehydratase domain-containing protein
MTLPLHVVPDPPGPAGPLPRAAVATPAAGPAPTAVAAPTGLPAPTALLPARPRLRTDRVVLWRAADAVQLGLGTESAVVVEGLTPPLAALVRALDGSRRTPELVAEAVARGADERAATTLLRALHAAGLLAGAGPTDPRLLPDAAALAGPGDPDGDDRLAPRAGAFVLVDGAGRVGVATACLLAASGVGRVHVRGRGLVTGADTGTGLLATDVGRPRSEAAADAVGRAAHGVVTRAPAKRRPDVVVLADTEVVDPVLARRPTARGQPHLAARVRETLGVVGPLVLPGRTACLVCLELARADADPAWPRLAAQLTGRLVPTPLALATSTAALAAEQVLAVLDGGEPLLDAVVEVDPRRGRSARRRTDAHPACPCRVAERTPGPRPASPLLRPVAAGRSTAGPTAAAPMSTGERSA